MSAEQHDGTFGPPLGVTHTPRVGMPAVGPAREKVRIRKPLHEQLALPGAIASGIGFALVVAPLMGLTGSGWVPIMAFGWMLASYAALTRLTEAGPAVKDRFATVMISSAGLLLVSLLTLLIVYVLVKGGKILPDLKLSFLTQDQSLVRPLDPLSKGGVLHAIVGTVEQISIALVLTVPLGIMTALFLNEIGGRYARLVRTVVEAMTALPSVVAGLFIYAAIIVPVTKSFNGFAASLAISVLMLPIMIRSSDVVMRLVPGNLREAGLALGAGQWSVVRRVVLPTVRSGLTTAIILATAHGIGETAPVLLTSGTNNNVNWNPFSGHQMSLPLAVLEFIKAPEPKMHTRAFATATLLLLLVLILFVTARLIGGQQAGELSNRQRRRRAAQSLRDLERIESNHAAIAAELAQQRSIHQIQGAPR
ncbi:MAG: phosphate ABC transporter permease PstA [Marmoricola sp.]